MNKTTILLALGLTIALGLATPQRSLGQNVGSTTNDDLPTSYGQFSVTNNTGMTIKYKRQWGSNGAWREITLLPGYSETHSHRLDNSGQAPTPSVYFFCLVANNRQLPVLRGGAMNQTMKFFRVIVGGYGANTNPGRPKPYQFVLSANGRMLNLRPMP